MLEKVIGNNHIKEVFQKMLERGRIPRSLLFVGEEGIGKKQLALQIAKSFVCQNPNNFQACDVCGACVRASRFRQKRRLQENFLEFARRCWNGCAL
jgi:DNA polymerase III gamma/tau subunit